MNLTEKTVEELEARQAEIAAENREEMTTEDIEARANELEAIKAELEARKKAAAEAEETRQKIADGEIGETKEEHREETKMTDLEMRGSAEYAEAYKKYIMSGNDKECRSLLTTIVSGELPVPTLVDDIIKHAWESNAFLSKVTKTAFRGIVKVPFEKSADPAYVHTEGATGLTEEDLQLGIVTLTPANIKKWIKISDEAKAMGGEEFVSYIYNELAQRVMEKLVKELVVKATNAPSSNSDVAIGVPVVNEAPGITVIRNAAATLSEEATDICVVMNPLTIGAFYDAQAAANYNMDPFAGVTLIKCSAMPAYSSADTNAMYAIVGDLKAFQVNYPEGEGVVTVWDPYTYSEDDMIKIVARQYAGYGITAPGRLVKLTKEAGAVTT